MPNDTSSSRSFPGAESGTTGTRVPTWRIESPIKRPTFRQLYREWKCGRKHDHGPNGCYAPTIIAGSPGWRVWEQECQACGRHTVWSERQEASDA